MTGSSATLSVQTLKGGWAGVMSFHGGSVDSQITRAAEHAATFAGIAGLPVRIELNWPKEES